MEEDVARKYMKRAFLRSALRKAAGLFAFAGLIYGFFALVYATKAIYKVKENHAVVLERFGGAREAITEVGWRFRPPFFTRIEQEVSLMNQSMLLGGRIEPMRTISRENVALWTSSVMTYRIRDLEKWALENLDPLELLQGDCDGIVKDILQASGIDALISDRESIKDDIFMALKSRPINEGGPTLEEKYGIEVVSFVLTETRFGDKLEKAANEKKKRELIAEAENYAAEQEAERVRKLYAAYLESIRALRKGLGVSGGAADVAMLEFLTQQKWASSYEKKQGGENTVVIQNIGENAVERLP